MPNLDLTQSIRCVQPSVSVWWLGLLNLSERVLPRFSKNRFYYVVFGKLFFAVAPFLNNYLLLADLSLSGIVSSTYGVCLSIEDCQGKDNDKITGFPGAFYSWNSGWCPPNSPRIPEFKIK
jgi:hypothetical protein